MFGLTCSPPCLSMLGRRHEVFAVEHVEICDDEVTEHLAKLIDEKVTAALAKSGPATAVTSVKKTAPAKVTAKRVA